MLFGGLIHHTSLSFILWLHSKILSNVSMSPVLNDEIELSVAVSPWSSSMCKATVILSFFRYVVGGSQCLLFICVDVVWASCYQLVVAGVEFCVCVFWMLLCYQLVVVSSKFGGVLSFRGCFADCVLFRWCWVMRSGDWDKWFDLLAWLFCWWFRDSIDNFVYFAVSVF